MKHTLLFTAMMLAAAQAQAAPRGLSPHDLVTLDRVSAPTLSPDATQLVYVLRQVDFEANKGITGIWLTDLEGKSPKRLTPTDSTANTPQWSPDGKHLYYLSTRSGSMQVWRQPLAGGDAQQVTDYPLDVGSYLLSPRGDAIAFSLEVFPDCDTVACTKQRLDAKPKGSGKTFDKLFVRHWDTWADGRRNQLYVSTLAANGAAAAEPVKLSRGIDGDVPSKPFGDQSEYAWSPDGEQIVFGARIAGKSESWSTNFDLYRTGIDGKAAPVNLTAANLAWDTGPVFSEDGNTLYYRAMKRPGFEADRFAVMAMDLDSKQVREIAPAWDASADAMVLAGGKLFTHASELGHTPLFGLRLDNGEVDAVAGEGMVENFDVADGVVVFTRSTLAAPAQLFVMKDGQPAKQISNFNADKLAGVEFGAFEQFRFAGHGGDTVHGFVVKPWNFEAGKRYPVAFIIHGGPQGSMGNSFHYRWNPQTYAAQGYAVVFVDFHGSTGYGQKFTDAISGDWGGAPLEDLRKGWAHALKSYDFLDGDKACALGASYGGYMVNWIAGNWNEPWDCLVNHDGVFDTRAMGYETEELWFTEWENEGTPFEKPENFEKFNPALHVAKWRVPMLVVQGELDYRIPVTQGLATFTALQRRGIESQLLYFPDENHWVLKPQNSEQWHEAVNAWLKKHLGG